MSCEGCEEGAYVIDALAKLLAEIAVIVNGVEPHDTSWSYHDLPEKVRALKQAQQPAAAAVPRTPDGYVYRYPSPWGGTVLKFTNGEDVNGNRPLEAVPYWLGTPPAQQPAANKENNDAHR